MTAKVITLATGPAFGGSKRLDATLAESLEVMRRYGASWLVEVGKARRSYPGCTLVHPADLPTDKQLEAVHEGLREVIDG